METQNNRRQKDSRNTEQQKAERQWKHRTTEIRKTVETQQQKSERQWKHKTTEVKKTVETQKDGGNTEQQKTVETQNNRSQKDSGNTEQQEAEQQQKKKKWIGKKKLELCFTGSKQGASQFYRGQDNLRQVSRSLYVFEITHMAHRDIYMPK